MTRPELCNNATQTTKNFLADVEDSPLAVPKGPWLQPCLDHRCDRQKKASPLFLGSVLDPVLCVRSRLFDSHDGK